MWKKIKKTKEYKVFMAPLTIENPVSVLVLGICSALAVTIQLKPSVVMVLAMTFVLTMSNITISFLRNVIPKNIRIIVELTVIASMVILADQFLKAFIFDVSKGYLDNISFKKYFEFTNIIYEENSVHSLKRLFCKGLKF